MSNLLEISKRAQELISSTKLLCSNQAKALELSLNNADQMLEISLSDKVSPEHILMAEVIHFFVKKRGYKGFTPISFREMESFLRDQNNVCAFKNSADWEASMMSFQFYFFGKLQFLALGSENLSFSKLENLQEKGSLVELNAYFLELAKALKWELILYKDGVLTISGIPEGDYRQNLDAFLAGFFNQEAKALPLKVVAV